MRGIYAITNVLSDTVYYGQSLQVENRLSNHKLALKKGIHENPRLQNSYNKHGEEAFIFTPIHIVEEKQIDLTPIEKKYIEDAYFLGLKTFNIRDPELKKALSEETKHRMSVAKIGNKHWLGHTHSLEQREKIRLRMLGKQHALGWVPSEETKRKIGLGNKSKIVSEETKRKLSLSKKGQISPQKGKKCSEETRRKIAENTKKQWLKEGMRERLSEAHKGKKLSLEQRTKISIAVKLARNAKKAPLSDGPHVQIDVPLYKPKK